MEIKNGQQLEHEKSAFLGYVLPTNNHQEITDGYMNLRLKHPQAASILCAYRIPGLPRCYYEDFCDDKEIGAGRFMLKLLQDNNITNTAVFVVRTQMGGKIGPIRHDLIAQAMQNAVSSNPYNKYINGNQSIQIEQRQPYQDASNRVRGFNRRGGRRQMGINPPKRHMEGERPKRRRSNSPTHERNWNEYMQKHHTPNGFQLTPPETFYFAAPEAVLGSQESTLGGSWPSLQQASNFNSQRR